MTLEQLAKAVGCEKYPTRWEEIYESVEKEFNEKGCIYAEPSFYEGLVSDYGILTQHIEVYKKAATEISKSRELSLFLLLICRALENREKAASDLGQCSLPTKGDELAVSMLPALVLASEMPYAHSVMAKRGIPEDIIRGAMSCTEKAVNDYHRRFGGYGTTHMLLAWNQLFVDGKLFRIGRLEIEVFTSFFPAVSVFEDRDGNRIALADGLSLHESGYAHGGVAYEDGEPWTAELTETDTAFIGYPLENCFAKKEKITLEKGKWQRVLKKGDPIVSLHIPRGGKLLDSDVEETVEMARDFLAKHFPDYAYKAFFCSSWLLDPKLETLLGDESNIVRFGKRFERYIATDKGTGVFYFAYGFPSSSMKPGVDFELSDLDESTTLLKNIKQHYLNGDSIHAVAGCFFNR